MHGRFQGDLVFNAHRHLYHSTLGSRVIRNFKFYTAGSLDLQPLQSGVYRRFQGGLVVKAHRLLHHSTLGSKVIRNPKPYTAGSLDA